MTPLHESALKVAVSLLYLNDGKGATIKDLKTLDWLQNTSMYGIDRFLQESERRGYARCTNTKEPFIYKANKVAVNKAQETYFS